MKMPKLMGPPAKVSTLMRASAILLASGILIALVSLAWNPLVQNSGSAVPANLQLIGAIVAPLGAAFTTIGVGVALYVAIRDSRRFANEARQRREEDNARRADQARLVRVHITSGSGFTDSANMKYGTIHAVNHSDGPLRTVIHKVAPTILDKITSAAPAEKAYPRRPHPILKKDEEYEWSFYYEGTNLAEMLDLMSVEFTDAKGIRWAKTHEAEEPTLVTPPSPK